MMRRLPEWHWASQSGMNFPDSGLPHDGRYIVWPDTASGNYADLMTCQLHETLQSHRSFDRRRRSSRSALPKDRADSAGEPGGSDEIGWRSSGPSVVFMFPSRTGTS